MTDRDHFAAAALTGLVANGDYSVDSTPTLAWRMADAMLRERSRAGKNIADSAIPRAVCPERDMTNHDAAPAARATADRYVRRAAADGGSDRTDHADSRPSESTGNTPVTEPMPVCVSGSGSVTPVPYQENDEKRVNWHAAGGTNPPRNGALSGCETVPDPDSRVWETQRTPQPHATPTQGSVQGDGSVPCSRTEDEPVAWIAVFDGDDADGEFVWPNAGLAREWASTRPGVEIAPLYRQPQPTLTNAEREAVMRATDGYIAWMEDNVLLHDSLVQATLATLRGLLERLK